MQTTVKVRWGKPILQIKYRTLKAIQICSIILCILMFLYCFNLFIVAMKLWNSLSNYIDMLSKNGVVFPGLAILPCVMCVVVNALIVHFLKRAFKGSKNKYVNSMLFMLIILCIIAVLFLLLICVIILLHAYSAREELHDGIIDAMRNYSKDSLIKAKVDQMQIEHQCCGSKNFSDWYTIKWYDANLINTGNYPQLSGETPFSCCSIKSSMPCVHHGIEVSSDAYIYRKNTNISISMNGCHSVILKVKRVAGWNLVLKILLLIFLQLIILIGLRLIQTAHTERKSFDREDKIYTCWLFGWYAGKIRPIKPPPEPPSELEEEEMDGIDYEK